MPIVRKNMPFVGLSIAHVIPFVCHIDPFTPSSAKLRGFTLTELMTTLVILGILVGIGYPTMQRVITEERLRSQVNDFVSDFSYSRSEAIKRKEPVIVCPFALVAGVPACDTGAGANWINGWLVYADTNDNRQLDVGETVLQQHPGAQGLASLVQRDAAIPANVIPATPIRVDLNGMAGVVAAAPPFPPPGSLSFCDDRGPTDGRRLSISAGGQTRTEKIGGGGAC